MKIYYRVILALLVVYSWPCAWSAEPVQVVLALGEVEVPGRVLGVASLPPRTGVFNHWEIRYGRNYEVVASGDLGDARVAQFALSVSETGESHGVIIVSGPRTGTVLGHFAVVGLEPAAGPPLSENPLFAGLLGLLLFAAQAEIRRIWAQREARIGTARVWLIELEYLRQQIAQQSKSIDCPRSMAPETAIHSVLGDHRLFTAMRLLQKLIVDWNLHIRSDTDRRLEEVRELLHRVAGRDANSIAAR